MNIIRFFNDRKEVTLGVCEKNKVYEISSLIEERINDLIALHKLATEKKQSLSEFITELNFKDRSPIYHYETLELLTPVDAPEVWACGVTYENSRIARNLEMENKQEGSLSVYDRVYDAVRPELFLKSTSARTVPPKKPVCIRSDSKWQIPEPELGLVLSGEGEIIGFTAGNDMSSRDIEGENPLYLPQAKIWKNSCSFGPSVRLVETMDDPYNLRINCRIYRNGDILFEGEASTSQLKRKYEELIEFLIRDNEIFDGTVLLTGTCIIPPDEFTLQEGDRIEIEVSGIGVLANDVLLTKSVYNKIDKIGK
ncbi:fumarylacetoacetate hydrolase family protein [Evansella sp. AB-P1]|uniref:fumarylacetoacetate hydrolase family protein n=1 Tax=Evansella sp. AB-P1 TaxID=3037653 RepID=UPI00241EAC92|nr:fumarylacetoacetate hydrolase family protein [Evansella sp. AB-P1]MDG5787168.1 fumarylacetoacetate hydrolase family protein [Evansella sp. AB-P1]